MDPRPSPMMPLGRHKEQPLYVWFAKQAQQNPTKIAVIDGDLSVNYLVLQKSIDRLADNLLRHGVGLGDRVAIWGERTATLPVAILAALKIGAVFVIMDPQYPDSRLAVMLGIARPKVLLKLSDQVKIPAAILSASPSIDILTVALNMDEQYSAEYVPTLDADTPAYIAFTSGTTGEPKGIIGSQAPLSHFLRWHIAAFGFDKKDRFLFLSGLSHDPALRDLLTPLMSGGTLVVPPPMLLRDPNSLRAFLDAEAITTLHLTPTMAELLCHGRLTAIAYRQLTQLRWAFFAGEILKFATVARLRQLAPLVECVNFYGATETPQAMGYHIIERDMNDPQATVSIGRGIADVQLLVLRPDSQLAAPGELGEICVRTAYLTEGYINSSELSRSRFIINPFTDNVEDRIYRTGDLGCYRYDGAIEICGRSDRQVKIRGFRIELDEIQTILLSNRLVKQAFVHCESEKITAYVVAEEEQKEDLNINYLRDFLRKHVPEFMVPSDIFLIDQLP